MDLHALARRRWENVRRSLPRIFQAAVAASIAWYLARLIPHHPRPFFAPVAAVVAMGAAPGTRGKQAIGLIGGVALGIGVAGVLVRLAGPGTWQIGVAAALAMTLGILISDRPVLVIQAGASAVLVIALHQPGAAPGRLIDALVGGGVAILIAQVLFPIDPLKLVAEAARAERDELARLVDEIAAALREGHANGARSALVAIDTHDDRRLADTLEVARGVVRRAPRRRWERRAIEGYAVVAQELHAMSADAAALASGALRVLRDDKRPPPEAADAAQALAQALRGLDVSSAAARARSSAALAVAATPSLGLQVFAHAVDAVAAHAERAEAVVAEANRRAPTLRSRVLRT